MTPADDGVLLVDWENLAGAILGRGRVVERAQVDDLWSFANRRCGDQLRHAHMAAAKFDGTISAAMREHLIEPETVRSTKEQADILLTVLAMDYLHAGVAQFFLVTGDQDFIPLISRLHRDGRRVTVIYGDPSRLTGELRQILTTPGLESIDIADITNLRQRKADTGCRSLLGLLELQRHGRILGGKEKGDRTAMLSEWGVLENDDENQYWSLVEMMCEKVSRRDAAVPGHGGEWLPTSATRTYLKLTPERLADVVALDHAVRTISSRPRGVAIGGLRTGPFQTDDGTLLDRSLDALVAVGRIRKGADEAFVMSGDSLQLGYLEELWRVFAGLSAECYRQRTASIPYGRLTPLLTAGGVGQGGEQRAAGRVREAVKYAQSAGVIDVVSVDHRRHVMAPSSAFSRPFEQAYHELYRTYSKESGTPIPQADVLGIMETKDSGRTLPVFGFDVRDRLRILRILSQSRLVVWRDGHVVFHQSAWGDAGLSLGH